MLYSSTSRTWRIINVVDESLDYISCAAVKLYEGYVQGRHERDNRASTHLIHAKFYVFGVHVPVLVQVQKILPREKEWIYITWEKKSMGNDLHGVGALGRKATGNGA
jgi:hypothetical protein